MSQLRLLQTLQEGRRDLWRLRAEEAEAREVTFLAERLKSNDRGASTSSIKV